MIEIELTNSEQIAQALEKLASAVKHRIPLMRSIAGMMESAVLQNFEAGGRPQWLGLKYREGKPLVDTGNLMSSIESSYDNDNAIVGTNVVYAAIHQFGGVIKPKEGKYLTFKIGDKWVKIKEVNIPARPFLKLTPEDEEDILQDVQDYFQSIIK